MGLAEAVGDKSFYNHFAPYLLAYFIHKDDGQIYINANLFPKLSLLGYWL